MGTEADREAAWARRPAIYHNDDKERWFAGVYDDVPSSRIEDFARHRTASTAALTAEIQRLREKLDNKDALAEAIHNARFNGPVTTAWAAECEAGKAYCYRIANAVELHLLAALSTPSEVSEPNPDEVAGIYSAFQVSEPVADHIGGEGEKVGWKCNNCQTVFTSTQQERREGDSNGGPNCPYCKAHGQYTYRYNLHQGDPCTGCGLPHDEVPVGPCLATPPNTNGDAVREALERATSFINRISLSGIAEPTGENWRQWKIEARALISDLVATLAKHGGAA